MPRDEARCRRAQLHIYTRQQSQMRLDKFHKVAVGGRRRRSFRGFIEALDDFLE